MKKITLSVALLASVLATKAQDTLCTYFNGKNVYEFNYQTDEILNVTTQETRFFTIDVKDKEILCLDLSDNKNRVRKVIVTYFDGKTNNQILNSKDNYYFSPRGTIKVSVGKPRSIILGK